MKRITLLILLFLANDLYSGNLTDSLEKILPDLNETEKMKVLNELAESYRNISPRKCLDYAFQALELSQKLDDSKAEAKAFYNIGNGYFYLSNYDDALKNYQNSLKISESIKDKIGVAGVLNSIGLVYRVLEKYDKAEEYYESALKIVSELSDKRAIAGSYNNLGILYLIRKDYNKALEYFNKSLLIKEESGDKNGMANTYNNLGMVSSRLNQDKQALEYYERSLKIKKELNDKNGIAVNLLNIGSSYFQLGEFKTAIEYFKQSVDYSHKEGLKATEQKGYAWLSDIYDTLGDYKKSLQYFKLNNKLQNEIFTEESSKKLAEMEVTLDVEKQKKENEILRKENEIQKIVRSYLYIIIGLVLILFLTFYARYRTKKKANNLLTVKNQEITAQRNKLEEAYGELEIKSNELEHRNQFLQTLIDSIPNPVFFKDRDLKYSGCNKEFEKFAGRSKEELKGHTVYDFASKDIADLTTKMDSGVLNNSNILQYEAVVYDKDQHEMDVIYYKKRYYDIDGNVAGIIGLMVDISERKKAEKILMESEIKLRELNYTMDKYLNIINSELKNAEEYLLSLLPPEIDEGYIKTQWRLIPSIQLGGDSFGYHWIDDDNIAFYLLDVSGHGIGAALHSVAILDTLRFERLKNTDFRNPSSVLYSLNRTFQMIDHNEMFFTIWYGAYNRKTRILKHACGGHHPALLIKPDGTSLNLHSSNYIIGAMPDHDFVSEEIFVEKGSEIYIFSDGAYEIKMSDGDYLGYDRLCDFIIESGKKGDKNLDDIYEFARNKSQDKTMKDDYSMLKITLL